LPEEHYSPEHLASLLILVPLITNPAYTNVYTDMGRSHPVQQPVDAVFSAFTEVINNHFDWHGGTPQPILTADQMASAFEAQSADGNLPIILKKFSEIK
jgi:hypothetical protein